MTWSPPTLVMATTLATRDGITELGLLYVVGIKPGTTVWAPGTAALPPGPWSGHGRKPTRLRRDESHQPVSVKALALSLKPSAYRTLTWREGSNAKLSSRFAAVRVTAAHGDTNRDQPRDQEWLLVEWPKGEPEPTKYFLSTLPADISRKELVAAVKGPLAHRARLPGAQTRIWTRRLRRPQLARLSSSRNALHRSLRVSRRRTSCPWRRH